MYDPDDFELFWNDDNNEVQDYTVPFLEDDNKDHYALPDFNDCLEAFDDSDLQNLMASSSKNKKKSSIKDETIDSKSTNKKHPGNKLMREGKSTDRKSTKKKEPTERTIADTNNSIKTNIPVKKSPRKMGHKERGSIEKSCAGKKSNKSSSTSPKSNTHQDEAETIAQEPEIKILTVLENVAIPIPDHVPYDVLAQTSETMGAKKLEENSPGTSKKKTKANRKPKNSKQEKFPEYLPLQEVHDGLKTGDLIKGVIRINPKNNRKAFVSNVNPLEEDYLLQPAEDRNRALEGDIVAIKLKPSSEWPKNKKTAVVVYILERVHSRITVGGLHTYPDNTQFGILLPRDFRLPRIRVPITDCPSLFAKKPYVYNHNILFKAKITKWNDTRYAIGNILEQLGKAGDLEVETTALIIESDLDTTEPLNLEEFPSDTLENREDLRNVCTFTIDPETAHDLDDAVSCVELANGNFEIGVHISDVTYYLKEGTASDKSACKKATTIYLMNKVFHMLPQDLCSRCSLIPGMDKLTFSVIWELTKTGLIIQQRFVRSVINSCVQLSYEHAQAMIEYPNRYHQLPRIFGGFTCRDLSRGVNFMHQIAVSLRAKRFSNGALRINQEKMVFRLDDKGEPIGFAVCEYKEANELIEEFMVLANISVAKKISQAFPDMAFLRCHGPPIQRLLVHWKKTLKLFCVDIEIGSSKELQESVTKLERDRKFGKLAMAVVKHFLIKPMVRAQYVCAANIDKKADFFHYSLHLPFYTHFTSPIRRYADITVHRLLSASLGYTKKHIWKFKYLTSVSNNCNKKKDSAKRAGDYSRDLYLAHYIDKNQPFIQTALVVNIKNHSFDVLVVGIATVIRINPKKLGDGVNYERLKENNIMMRKSVLYLPETAEFAAEKLVLHLFTILTVNITRIYKTRRLEANLVRKKIV